MGKTSLQDKLLDATIFLTNDVVEMEKSSLLPKLLWMALFLLVMIGAILQVPVPAGQGLDQDSADVVWNLGGCVLASFLMIFFLYPVAHSWDEVLKNREYKTFWTLLSSTCHLIMSLIIIILMVVLALSLAKNNYSVVYLAIVITTSCIVVGLSIQDTIFKLFNLIFFPNPKAF
ncbi:MAG: hypothetical protein NTX82_07455 [Candidatus Parcubacteria bacterium]|nr:hypothetical protein [Candidatus Parcubacteria bacterium]